MVSKFVPTFSEKHVITEVLNVNIGNTRVWKDLKQGFIFFPLNFVVAASSTF